MKTSLILASTSPRRIDLMKQTGFEVKVESPDADETPHPGESPRALVSRLAREKAFSIGRKGFRGGKLQDSSSSPRTPSLCRPMVKRCSASLETKPKPARCWDSWLENDIQF